MKYIAEPDCPAPVKPETQFLVDTSRSVVSFNQSSDVGFDASLNPYRGCEHGCAYCYARPTHEYLEFSAGLDFETKIMVKTDAPQLLEKTLGSRKWKPQVLALSGVTDCYQPVERKLKLTRQCLEVLERYRNPVVIITKNRLIERDIDLLRQLNAFQGVAVYISITTLDDELQSRLEPRASTPRQRLLTIEKLASAGIPVGVLSAPVIPGLTDHEMPAILQRAADSGAGFASYIVLRLPFVVRDLFTQWLETHLPTKKDRVLNRVRALRGGRLNDSRFGLRMKGEGIFAEQIAALFTTARRKAEIDRTAPKLSTASFISPSKRQLALFS